LKIRSPELTICKQPQTWTLARGLLDLREDRRNPGILVEGTMGTGNRVRVLRRLATTGRKSPVEILELDGLTALLGLQWTLTPLNSGL
jgi:hypothetical protein